MEVLNRTPFKVAWLPAKRKPPQWTATFLVKGTFRLRPGAAAETAEEQSELSGDVHVDRDPGNELRYPDDFAVFKPRADLLLVGTCAAPGGIAAESVPVRFQVGAFSKSLAVTGDHAWRGPVTPFLSMPLTYAKAYGPVAANPVGTGRVESAGPMPNIEWIDRRIADPEQGAEPAGIGPVSGTWAPRSGLVGSFGRDWLKKRWPWYPAARGS